MTPSFAMTHPAGDRVTSGAWCSVVGINSTYAREREPFASPTRLDRWNGRTA